jgi:hypothetical protein
MRRSTDRMPKAPWPGETDEDHVAGLTRRSVLAGAAATAAATIGADTPTGAQAETDLDIFVKLSAALTGIAKVKLAPATDPVDIKEEYFRQASNPKYAAAFTALLQLTRAVELQIPGEDTDATWPMTTSSGVIPQDKVDGLVARIEARDDTKFLARSIVLMWYLGAWYEPDNLRKLAADPKAFVPHTIISSKAYTQGWVWRVAQAHPMGYSDMQFGYWTRPPAAPAEFIAVVKKRA